MDWGSVIFGGMNGFLLATVIALILYGISHRDEMIAKNAMISRRRRLRFILIQGASILGINLATYLPPKIGIPA
jgi:hypothetical protein